MIFLIATKQPVKQIRRRTRNSYCASGNPIFSRSFLPLHYRELRVCHRLPEAEAARDGSSSCLIPHPVLYRLDSSRIHNECRASQLYRVCGRASRFPRTTLAPNPFQPFGSLFSDSKPADLQLSHPPPREGEKVYACSALVASTFVLWSMLADFLHLEQTEYFSSFSLPSLSFSFSLFFASVACFDTTADRAFDPFHFFELAFGKTKCLAHRALRWIRFVKKCFIILFDKIEGF